MIGFEGFCYLINFTSIQVKISIIIIMNAFRKVRINLDCKEIR